MVNVTNIPKCSCPCTCTAKQQAEQHDETMKVTEFLTGLNELYTNIRGQLLMMTPMPQMTQVLALLQQVERQRNCVTLQFLMLAFPCSTFHRVCCSYE